MSTKNDFIILEYNGEQKKIKIPNNFNELEAEFLKEFNEEKTNKTFSFSYPNKDDQNIILGNAIEDFSKIINELTEKENPIVKISQNISNESDNEKEDKKENNVNLNRANKISESILSIDESSSIKNSNDNSVLRSNENNSQNNNEELEGNLNNFNGIKEEHVEKDIDEEISNKNEKEKPEGVNMKSKESEENSLKLKNEMEELKKKLNEIKKRNEELKNDNNNYIQKKS